MHGITCYIYTILPVGPTCNGLWRPKYIFTFLGIH